MAHCQSCHSYVLYESAVCASCFEQRNNLWVVEDEFPDTYGLHNREWNFRYKMIKGKIAETLIQQLFLSHKYSVYHYGMEYTMPALSAVGGSGNPVMDRIRNMPDFVVQHRLYKETYFVEVKFRANGRFSEKDLDKNYPYDDALVIVVSKNDIKCLSVKELRQGFEISPECSNHLSDRPEFQLRKDVVIDFCRFAETVFEGV
ncbi:MAG TPA: hypothetical protein VD993_16305 [Chitinophagaceae bacterium]|nr:hypothetical protein [Chitinophagaceae bacterium]